MNCCKNHNYLLNSLRNKQRIREKKNSFILYCFCGWMIFSFGDVIFNRQKECIIDELFGTERCKPALGPILLVANRIYFEFSGLLFLFVLNTSLAKGSSPQHGHLSVRSRSRDFPRMLISCKCQTIYKCNGDFCQYSVLGDTTTPQFLWSSPVVRTAIWCGSRYGASAPHRPRILPPSIYIAWITEENSHTQMS